MKTRTWTIFVFKLLLVLVAAAMLVNSACFASNPSPMDLTQYVNPFIGTNPTTVGGEPKWPFPFNTGDVFPGADYPFGMVQFSPDTPSDQAGGYWYPDKVIKAFSLTHFSGRGIPYEGDLGFMPVSGTLAPGNPFHFSDYSSTFSHENESAAPGYYAVTLDNGNKVEVTTTAHTGMMQETFPAGTATGTMLLNVANSVRGVSDAQVEFVDGNELTGFAKTTVSNGVPYTIYFSVVFDRPITGYGTWNGAVLTPSATSASGTKTGAYVTFDTSGDRVVHLVAGISYVSVANARLNRTTEDAGPDFSAVRLADQSAWNVELNRIKITDPNAKRDDLVVFYTELYRTFFHPNMFDDVNGQYLGVDNQVHTVLPGHHFYTHIEGWGGYRTTSPFLAFLLPHIGSDMAQSLVQDSEENHTCVARWMQQNIDTRGNAGDGGVNYLASAYAFGATDFDTATALKNMDANASGVNGYREHAKEFLSLGWVPGDDGLTLEYCITDFALAQFAKSLGSLDIYDKYMATTENWRNNFDSATLSIRQRDASGNWVQSISYEGSAAQYTWVVPQNMAGLFAAMGGSDKVVPRLDAFFGWDASTGMYTGLNAGIHSTKDSTIYDAQYNNAGDQTCENHPWMFLFTGEPWKTQKVVRDIQTTLYFNDPSGMPGNDDGGELSSWYVFSALGIYPFFSGVGGLVVGSPRFAHAVLTTESGHVLRVDGIGAAPNCPYVQGLEVDGKAYDRLWIPISTILGKKTTRLTFKLGPAPNEMWASSPSDSPPSFAGAAP